MTTKPHRSRPLASKALPACALLLALSSLAACRSRHDTEQTAFDPPPPRPPAVDQAAQDEIAEGTDRAFGLPIPRAMHVTARFPDAVYFAGSLSLEATATFVRQRVTAALVDTGPSKTVFSGATLKAAPQQTMRIEVISLEGETQVVVRDETRPKAREGLSEEERWREVGLDPKGRLLDPTHLE